MKTSKRNTIPRPTNRGIKKECHVLEFFENEGRFKKNKDGVMVLNIKKKIKCISIVDARAVLLKYLLHSKIPSYDICREIIKQDGYLGVMKIHRKYFLA